MQHAQEGLWVHNPVDVGLNDFVSTQDGSYLHATVYNILRRLIASSYSKFPCGASTKRGIELCS
jgi:hypothetical protein